MPSPALVIREFDKSGQARSKSVGRVALPMPPKVPLATPPQYYLADSIYNGMYSRISNLTPSNAVYDIYSYKDDNTHQFTRNPNIWTTNVDLTCVPSSRFSVTGQFPGIGVLVAPDVLLCAWHSRGGVGDTVWFTDNSNNVYSASFTAVTSGSATHSADLLGSDICLCKLDVELPPSIKPASVLPPECFSGSSVYITQDDLDSNRIVGMRAFGLFGPPAYDADKRTVRLNQLDYIAGDKFVWVEPPVLSPFDTSGWFVGTPAGESGNGTFLIIDSELVLLGTWYVSNGCPWVSYYISKINSIMADLGSVHTLQVKNLNKYSLIPVG